MPNLFNIDFLEFLELLGKHKVDYMLVGGYAVILHGYSRSTGDLDLWINQSSENYNKLKKVYIEFGAPIFSLEDFQSDKFDVWSIGIEPRKIEILTKVSGLHFFESKKNCQWLNIENIKIPYIDFEDLIKNKQTLGRYKDLADIEQLKKLKKQMPQDVNIKITDRNGVVHEVQAPTDMNMNIMELIRAYELAEEGTIGICGGMAMCASCQCYILNDVVSIERNPDEEAMLWEAYHVKENSRLGCQIPITQELEGLEIEIAPEQ